MTNRVHDVIRKCRPRAIGGRHSVVGLFFLAITLLIGPSPLVSIAGAQTNGNGTSGFLFAGDFRLRYEETTKQEPNGHPGRLDPRHRMVIRFRAGVTKQVGDLFTVNARVATGSRGDPNTTDVTLGDFVDKIEISLDRVNLEFKRKDVYFAGGRIMNPFVKGQLVWDDDVHPAGLGLVYTLPASRTVVPKFTSVYSIVDEATVNPDSYMVGGQMQVLVRPRPRVSIMMAGAFYDYTIKSLTRADAGDIQSNYVTPDRSEYLSDFNIADAVVTMDAPGFGQRFPLRLVANYVKNLGAAVPEDQGYAFDVFLGRASANKDMRYRYGYSVAETDAVLGAFSHDDTTFATNYKQHSLTFDYMANPNLLLNATSYIYKRANVPQAEYLFRLRLNATVIF